MRNILKYIGSRHLITDSIWRIEISRNILKGSCWFERGKQGQAAAARAGLPASLSSLANCRRRLRRRQAIILIIARFKFVNEMRKQRIKLSFNI